MYCVPLWKFSDVFCWLFASWGLGYLSCQPFALGEFHLVIVWMPFNKCDLSLRLRNEFNCLRFLPYWKLLISPSILLQSSHHIFRFWMMDSLAFMLRKPAGSRFGPRLLFWSPHHLFFCFAFLWVFWLVSFSFGCFWGLVCLCLF